MGLFHGSAGRGSRRPALAAPAALLAVAVAAVVLVPGSLSLPALPLPRVVLVQPSFTLAAVTQVALPVYVVTMAGQNLVGLAVLQANGSMWHESGRIRKQRTYESSASALLATRQLTGVVGDQAPP